MRPIGFSTGALAKGDFRQGLALLRQKKLEVVELSALREDELPRLIDSLDSLDLSEFSYVSLHAPSRIQAGMEGNVILLLQTIIDKKVPIIMHPDAIREYKRWRVFGKQLCIENMDYRKAVGRTASELMKVFQELPGASFCFDIGHARQVDPTMSEAALMLRSFGDRLRQLHVSEVSTKSTHDRLTVASINAFNKVDHLIPDHIPVVLETPVSASDIEAEMASARLALPSQQRRVLLKAV